MSILDEIEGILGRMDDEQARICYLPQTVQFDEAWDAAHSKAILRIRRLAIEAAEENEKLRADAKIVQRSDGLYVKMPDTIHRSIAVYVDEQLYHWQHVLGGLQKPPPTELRAALGSPAQERKEAR